MPLNIGEPLWWLHTSLPCFTTVVGWQTLEKKYVSKFKQSPINDDEGGVGGMNCAPHLVKPLVIVSLSLESWVTFVMNPKS
jgi:hypothetical protein